MRMNQNLKCIYNSTYFCTIVNYHADNQIDKITITTLSFLGDNIFEFT